MILPPLGLIQGRLTPSNGRGIQFFPSGPGEWEREFAAAASIGIPHLQWVCDADTNPLLNEETQTRVRELMAQTGVTVRNLDFQFLTKRDIATSDYALFSHLSAGLAAVEGGTLEVPLMEASSLLDESHYSDRLKALDRLIAIAATHGLQVAVETDLPPGGFADLLARPLTIVYDAGNSAGMGYDLQAEWAAYGDRVSNVHVKDKPLGGSTVPLGAGSVNFVDLFSILRKMDYVGHITIQAARGEDGNETNTIAGYVSYINEQWQLAATHT